MSDIFSLPPEPLVGELPLDMWGWDGWEVRPWDRDPIDMGYNSYTFLAEHDSRKHVVKCVPAGMGPKFTDGLSVAKVVEEHGIPAGGPLLTTSGEVTAYQGEWCWAVLKHLDGEQGSEKVPDHLCRVGETLGAIHGALLATPPPAHITRWDRLDAMLADAPFLTDKPWIQQAMHEARDAVPADATMGLTHADPVIAAFRMGDGWTGIIDWGEVAYAPCLYDVAITLSYLEESVDARPLLEGYLAKSPVQRSELSLLGPLLKFRAAAEAWVYARREWTGNNVGFDGGPYTNAMLIERAQRNIESAEENGRRFQQHCQ